MPQVEIVRAWWGVGEFPRTMHVLLSTMEANVYRELHIPQAALDPLATPHPEWGPVMGREMLTLGSRAWDVAALKQKAVHVSRRTASADETMILDAVWTEDLGGATPDDPHLMVRLSNAAILRRALSSLMEQRRFTVGADYLPGDKPQVVADRRLRLGRLYWTLEQLRGADPPHEMGKPAQPVIVSAKWDLQVVPLLLVLLSNGTSILRTHTDLMDARGCWTGSGLRYFNAEPQVVDMVEPFDQPGTKGLLLNGTMWSFKQLLEAPAFAQHTRDKRSANPVPKPHVRLRLGNQHIEGLDPDSVEGLDPPEYSEGLKRAMAARDRLFGTQGEIDALKVPTPQAHAIQALKAQLTAGGVRFDESEIVTVKVQSPKPRMHVDGCACTSCTLVRAHIDFIEPVERELSCPLCRRVYGRVMVQSVATVEVLCKGCEVEGRVKP